MKNRTESRRYPSRYSPEIDDDGFAWITGRQYIVEMVCENKAAKEGKELPRGFYTKDLQLADWQKFYREQINNRSLSKLIDKHGVDKIISFLKSNKYVMSLRPKWVHEKIEEYTYVERTTGKEDLSYDFNSKESFTSNNHKRSIISKLEELE
jgi:hypothetical protein